MAFLNESQETIMQRQEVYQIQQSLLHSYMIWMFPHESSNWIASLVLALQLIIPN